MANSTSSSERRRRLLAVNFARASIGLEGFVPSKLEEARAQRFVDGEIDLGEFLRQMDETQALVNAR